MYYSEVASVGVQLYMQLHVCNRIIASIIIAVYHQQAEQLFLADTIFFHGK